METVLYVTVSCVGTSYARASHQLAATEKYFDGQKRVRIENFPLFFECMRVTLRHAFSSHDTARVPTPNSSRGKQ